MVPDKMFIKHASLRHPKRHHELFMPSRPYRGEPPTVAGFLLYPDTPAKMETTSREAFCVRPVPQFARGKGDHVTQNTKHPHPKTSRQSRGGNSSRERARGEDEQGDDCVLIDSAPEKSEGDMREMQSQYQKDFPPPSSCRRRRTPALPQPDNIGINPAFRIEFRTVQREAFPSWSLMDPQSADRLRAASTGRPNTTSE